MTLTGTYTSGELSARNSKRRDPIIDVVFGDEDADLRDVNWSAYRTKNGRWRVTVTTNKRVRIAFCDTINEAIETAAKFRRESGFFEGRPVVRANAHRADSLTKSTLSEGNGYTRTDTLPGAAAHSKIGGVTDCTNARRHDVANSNNYGLPTTGVPQQIFSPPSGAV